MSRPQHLNLGPRRNNNAEIERKLRDIMKISGDLTIDGRLYKTNIQDMELLEQLGHGTCGQVFKMRHKPSGKVIAVKQMRRSGNSDETKRIIMDIEVVLKSDCKYIVKCLGCFITEAEVWICMELMDTCFDKLLKKLQQPLPEDVLGKVSMAVRYLDKEIKFIRVTSKEFTDGGGVILFKGPAQCHPQGREAVQHFAKHKRKYQTL